MKKLIGLALLLAFVAAPAVAQPVGLGPVTEPVGNLEPGFPTAIADTTTTPATAVEFGVAGSYRTNGGTWEEALIQVNYGILDELQLRGTWNVIIGEGRVDGNFDTVAGLLWVPVLEEDMIPSMGIEISGRAPTGLGYTGYDASALGILTKTFGEARVHLNAGYTTIGDRRSGIRNDADFYALGMDYVIQDDLILVANASTEEARWKGVKRIHMIEAGVRSALTDVDILSFGVGAGLGPGKATPAFTATVGYQRAM